MNSLPLRYRPSLDVVKVKRRLAHLLVAGQISDQDLNRRLAKLDECFRVYAATCPHGLWAPGLVLTPEMGRVIELYLPMAEIKRSFRRFFTLAFHIPPGLPAYPFHASQNWLDCLAALGAEFRRVNPAELLRSLIADEVFRFRFIFSVFLPRHHGGGFGRYPEQSVFVRSWLKMNRSRLGRSVCCLDAACGTGEGTFDLALLLAEEGIPPECMQVHGSTLEAVEIFAAAHGYFPHDPDRQKAYRQRIQPLISAGAAARICFRQEDLNQPDSGAVGGYDLILCNGLLGGPALYTQKDIEQVIGVLVERLKPEGILLATDRFHDGWKKSVPKKLLCDAFAKSRIRLLEVGEGMAGVKSCCC